MHITISCTMVPHKYTKHCVGQHISAGIKGESLAFLIIDPRGGTGATNASHKVAARKRLLHGVNNKENRMLCNAGTDGLMHHPEV